MNAFEWWTIKQKTHDEVIDILKKYQDEKKPWVKFIIKDLPMYPANPNSTCRIGYVPYNNCVQDRYFYIDKSRKYETLAAGGISTQIYWNYNKETLPEGWQGAVKQSYIDSQTQQNKQNTMVALLAFTFSRYRKRGFSDKILSKMCLTAQERNYKYLLAPALLPSKFKRENVRASMNDIIKMKRDDVEYYDFWLRTHTRKGAEIIGSCESSHRFILSLKDFNEFVSSDAITNTGEHCVRLDKDRVLSRNGKNMWQLVYADIKRSYVTFNWGCVWVVYDLEKLHFSV